MRNSALQERRNRQILADLVRTYIETGEPVSSRAISKSFEETLSTATIRNVMADLEDAGFLYQPHTSAGRVPTAAAYRFFAQEIASQATISVGDREWIQREMGGASSAAEITERAGHVLAEVSNGLGIIVSPPLGKTVLEHVRMWLLPDGRVVVVLISPGADTRHSGIRQPGAIARTAGGHRREAPARDRVECLHRNTGARARADWREGDFPGGRQSRAHQRRLYEERSGAGFAWRAGADAHAL